MFSLKEAFVFERTPAGTTGPKIQAVIDRISSMNDGDWIGDTDDARELIMGLIDQAGFSLQEQERFRKLLRFKDPAEER
jgi:hypothetical protein